MKYRLAILALFMISPLLMGNAFAHQADAVGDYRIEIDDFNREIDDLRGDIRELQETINELKQEPTNDNSGIMFAAIVLGIAGIIIGAASFAKKK